jgi:sterol desaturase/sphingolipid hydroxylase (fatty acid hydroxylase superfamily)
MFSKISTSLKLRLPESLPEFSLPDWALPDLTAADWRTLAVLGCFALLLALEAPWCRAERRPRVYRQSYLANLGTLFINDILLSLLSAASLWLFAEQYGRWGLLSGLEDSWWKGALAFLLLDLTLYFWHRANHAFDGLWQFHKVHHSDPTMNVTTAFRLHLVEVLLTLLVKAAFIVAVGVDADWVLASESVIALFVMLHHANLSFPGEHWLSRLAVVPRLHRTHHSIRREEHDRNYGFVFSWWDRLFGTLAEVRPKRIGLRGVGGMGPLELLKFGLTGQAAPAALPALAGGGSAGLVGFGLSTGATPGGLSLRAMIAEAAYFRAEKRGFAPGYESLDWLEAEREIQSRLRGA